MLYLLLNYPDSTINCAATVYKRAPGLLQCEAQEVVSPE